MGIENLLDLITQSSWKEHTHSHAPAKVDFGTDIGGEINILETLIAQDSSLKTYPKTWLAIKLLENDPSIAKFVTSVRILEQAQKSRRHIEEHFNESAETKIAEFRYGFTASVAKKTVKDIKGKKRDWTPLIDKFVLNRFLGLPIFAAVMFLIFTFTFSLSEPLIGIFESFFEWLGGAAGNIIPEGRIQSLVVDGLIAGIGAVLGFFPLVLFMFFAIAFFEDSGYMARAAFVMDKIMSKFGLHGKSFLPMMISTNGCAVPGIMATRTLDSNRDRLITMFISPFMICGAKLPIFVLFIGAFFAKNQAMVMFLMYALSVCIAFVAAKILSLTVLKGEPAHFVMELPPYHIPTLKGILLKMWERGWLYIKRAGTILVLLNILIWAGFTYPEREENPDLSPEENAAVQMESSYLGSLGKVIEPVSKTMGIDGNKTIALIAGLAAKEVVVSALGTIYSLGEIDPEGDVASLQEKLSEGNDWSPLIAIAFLIFCMIYPPCIAAVAVFFKETGSKIKYLLLLVVGNTIVAWIAATLVFQIGTILRIGI